MALTAGTIFEIRADALSGNLNGAGFNAANANMLTDLAATDANTTTPDVSSATYTFVAGDVGSYLYIKAGTNWTVGWYPISAVNAGVATLDAAIGSVVTAIDSRGLVTRNTVVGCATVASPTSGTFTVDYTQQAAAALTGTDLTCTAGSTTVTSATGGFTPVMVGNLIHLIDLTGTGAIIGWYEIVSYTNTNNIVLDRTPTDGANNITAGTFYVSGAGRLNGLEDEFKVMVPASSRVFIKNGTYTLSASATSSSTNSTATAASFFRGYNAVRGDACNRDNRPLIAAGANNFTWCQYQMDRNMRYTTTTSSGIASGTGNTSINCKIENTSTTASRSGGTSGKYFSCELISQNGRATNTGVNAFGCYIHDSAYGHYGTSSIIACGNIFAHNTNCALQTSASNGSCQITDNTIYGRAAKMADGVRLTGSYSPNNKLLNNNFVGLTNGISVTDGAAESNISMYNNFYNNTTDVTNWTKGETDTALTSTFANVSEVTGTTATSADTVLTDTSKNFTTTDVVVDGQDYLHVVSGTDATAACYKIISHDATTVTVNNSIGTSATGDIVYWISRGHNFMPSSELVGVGFPNFTEATEGTNTSYPTIGAVIPQISGGSSVF